MSPAATRRSSPFFFPAHPASGTASPHGCEGASSIHEEGLVKHTRISSSASPANQARRHCSAPSESRPEVVDTISDLQVVHQRLDGTRVPSKTGVPERIPGRHELRTGRLHGATIARFLRMRSVSKASGVVDRVVCVERLNVHEVGQVLPVIQLPLTRHGLLPPPACRAPHP